MYYGNFFSLNHEFYELKRIIMTVFERLSAKWRRKRELEIAQGAEIRYQVQENEGELWLTFNGCLVCPASMLKQPIVEAVKEMRQRYIDRCK